MFLTDEAGVLTWVIQQGTEWYLGPVLGPLFLDAWGTAYNSMPVTHTVYWA